MFGKCPLQAETDLDEVGDFASAVERHQMGPADLGREREVSVQTMRNDVADPVACVMLELLSKSATPGLR